MQPGYIYVLVRKDIPQPHISVQIAHAVLAATNTFIGSACVIHPNLVVCAVDDEPTLDAIFQHLKDIGIPVCSWTEDDMGNSLTAIATGILRGDQRKPFRKFKLIS